MSLEDYQNLALESAVYPGQRSFTGLCYLGLKLNGEAGEVAEKIGKAWRDNEGSLSGEEREALVLELGDVLWYLAALSKELGWSLEAVARTNLEKLAKRASTGTIGGSGDYR